MNHGKVETLALWATIASSIAAIVSLVLLGYQLKTDRPDLRVSVKGVASADYPKDSKLYFAVRIEAFNKGKRPVGIMEAKLEVIFPGKSKVLLTEVPAFPRYQTGSATNNLPAIELPFFYEPDYQDTFVKDKEGNERPFDYHPKRLERDVQILDIGGYRVGFAIFGTDQEQRGGLLLNPNLSRLTLILYTTEGERRLPVSKINKWKPETFGSRFFIVRTSSNQPSGSVEAPTE